VVEEVLANWIYVQLCFLLEMPVKLHSYATSAKHPCSGARHPYFGCAVVPSTVSALRFPKYYLDMTPSARLGDAPLLDSVMYWLQQTANRTNFNGLLYRNKPISLSTLGFLTGADLSFDACCDALRVSPRDFRQALIQEGSSFREIRRVALVNRVRPQLGPSTNLEDVAETLGYSDARSLRRGLKAATGLSISRLRMMDSDAAMIGSPRVLQSLRECLAAA
jgi:AraC-like DNA-binding protein